jgi:anti-anti-sigma factor
MAGYRGGAFDRDFAVCWEWEAEVLRIALMGELGPYAVPRLNTCLESLVASPMRIASATIDLSRLYFIDLEAVRALASVCETVRDRSASLRVLGATPEVQGVIQRSGVGIELEVPLDRETTSPVAAL